MKILKKYLISDRDAKSDGIDYAWGWCWSLWPMIGVRTLLGGVFFMTFKKPKSIFILTNQIGFFPFLLLYFPHLRIGELIWKAERLEFTFLEMWNYVSADPLGSLLVLLPSILHAITGWLILSPVHFLFSYLFVYYVLEKYGKN